ncbi:Hematopoietic prostaglandin D synthase [Phytophthora nicotianae]|uniref:Hematopoietic prostaglandin D synthase n=1 Tax=Phytophthora nicotianae TaxID=4792 RepID=A0A0W8D8R8_PHYNI|nr:Hematopoietic prostaglandin D synthase [Phytophthora nicotianae]
MQSAQQPPELLAYKALQAVQRGNAEELAKLIQAGANTHVINAVVKTGTSPNGRPDRSPHPLRAAVVRKNLELVTLLLKRGANVNRTYTITTGFAKLENRTPLWRAMQQWGFRDGCDEEENFIDVCHVLLSQKATPPSADAFASETENSERFFRRLQIVRGLTTQRDVGMAVLSHIPVEIYRQGVAEIAAYFATNTLVPVAVEQSELRTEVLPEDRRRQSKTGVAAWISGEEVLQRQVEILPALNRSPSSKIYAPSVFRPREKERYKLRKHRKNDLEGFRKLQQLRVDFERVRRLLDLVRRRERAKRLQLDFLDEIRRQAEHELTNRGPNAVVRKPVIPVDEARERHKKKKKKKKKHRDGENGSLADGMGTSGDSKTGAEAKTGKAGTAVEGPQIAPTFMEYDTSANFVMEDTTDTDGSPRSGPVYPSYPLSQPRLMAAIFQQPPKYRCRGRIGRGGRLVMDRIPVPTSRYYGVTETNAPTLKSASLIPTAAVSGLTTPENGVNLPGSEVGIAANHGAVLVQDLSVHPPMNKINQVTSKRLDEIYGMSDSEDEFLEPLSSSVYETRRARRQVEERVCIAQDRGGR